MEGKTGREQGKATTYFEWTLAMVIFLMIFAISLKFLNAKYLVAFHRHDPEVAAAQIVRVAEAFSTDTEAYMGIVNGCHVEHYPVEFTAANSSITTCFQKNRTLPVGVHDGKIRSVVTTGLPFLCVSSRDIKTYGCVSDLREGANSILNTYLEVGYGTTFITYLDFNGTDYLFQPVLMPSSFQRSIYGCSFIELDFNTTELIMDAYSPRLWLISESPQNYTLVLVRYFDTLYDGTSSTTLVNGWNYVVSTGFISLYDTNTGVNMNFLTDSSTCNVRVGTLTIRVRIENTKRTEIYFCDGAVNCGDCEDLLFTNSSTAVAGRYLLRIWSDNTLNSIKNSTYEKIKEESGVTGFDFNVTIGNFTFGKKEPLFTNIWVRKYPGILLYQNGTITPVDMVIRLWR